MHRNSTRSASIMAFTAQRALLATFLVGGALVWIDRTFDAPAVPEVSPSRSVTTEVVGRADATTSAVPALPATPVTVSTSSDVAHVDPPAHEVAYALTGTSVSSGGTIGFLREIGGERTWSVRKGDRVNDAVVVDVATDHVTLARGTARQVVALGDAPVTPAALARPTTSEMPALAGGEPADGDSGSEELPVVPGRQSVAPMSPAIAGTAPTLNSVDPPFDPAHQKGESASADEGSD